MLGGSKLSNINNKGKITKNEFMKIFEVYELWKYENEYARVSEDLDTTMGSKKGGKYRSSRLTGAME